MNWKTILLATMLLFAGNAFAPWTATIDVNGVAANQSSTYSTTTTDGVLCGTDDANFSIKLKDVNAGAAFFVTFNGTQYAIAIDLNGDQTINQRSATTTTDVNVSASAATKSLSGANIKVRVPSTEDLYVLCVVDANSAIVENSFDRQYCETVGVRPDATKTNYTITNTDGNGFCKTSSYSSFTGTIKDTTGYGIIETARGQTWDLSSDLSFDTTIVWANPNQFTVTTSTLVGKAAKVTFLKPEIRSSKFQIKKDDSGCSVCDNIESNNGQISFTTNGFSKYEVVEMPSDGTIGAGGGEYQPPNPLSILGGLGGGTGDSNVSAIIIVIIIAAVALLLLAKKKK